jgi:hypothetical protein
MDNTTSCIVLYTPPANEAFCVKIILGDSASEQQNDSGMPVEDFLAKVDATVVDTNAGGITSFFMVCLPSMKKIPHINLDSSHGHAS